MYASIYHLHEKKSKKSSVIYSFNLRENSPLEDEIKLKTKNKIFVTKKFLCYYNNQWLFSKACVYDVYVSNYI